MPPCLFIDTSWGPTRVTAARHHKNDCGKGDGNLLPHPFLTVNAQKKRKQETVLLFPEKRIGCLAMDGVGDSEFHARVLHRLAERSVLLVEESPRAARSTARRNLLRDNRHSER